MGWLKKLFGRIIIEAPAKATEAQRSIALSELLPKLDTPELSTDSFLQQVGKNFETVKAFMETLEDPTERDAYAYWVEYFEDKYKQKRRRRDAYNKNEAEKKALKETFSRPKW